MYQLEESKIFTVYISNIYSDTSLCNNRTQHFQYFLFTTFIYVSFTYCVELAYTRSTLQLSLCSEKEKKLTKSHI